MSENVHDFFQKSKTIYCIFNIFKYYLFLYLHIELNNIFNLIFNPTSSHISTRIFGNWFRPI